MTESQSISDAEAILIAKSTTLYQPVAVIQRNRRRPELCLTLTADHESDIVDVHARQQVDIDDYSYEDTVADQEFWTTIWSSP